MCRVAAENLALAEAACEVETREKFRGMEKFDAELKSYRLLQILFESVVY